MILKKIRVFIPMLQLFHEKIRNFKKFYTFWRFDISIHILKILKKKKKKPSKEKSYTRLWHARRRIRTLRLEEDTALLSRHIHTEINDPCLTSAPYPEAAKKAVVRDVWRIPMSQGMFLSCANYDSYEAGSWVRIYIGAWTWSLDRSVNFLSSF